MIVSLDLSYKTAQKLAEIASQRFDMETSGVEWNGYIIRTDRESAQILDSLIEKIRRGLIPAVMWKCVVGWIELNPSNVDEIETMVLTHVQAAFNWEKAQQEQL